MKKESFEPQFLSHADAEVKSEKPKQEIVKVERSPQETQQLKERLHFVAKSLSKNFGLKFIPGKGWAAGLSQEFIKERARHPEKSLEDFDEGLLTPETITYPEDQLAERSEDFVFGVLRHELGHIKHSDYRALLESQKLVQEEGYHPMDAFTIYDAWEDGRANNLESRTSKAARYRLGCYLREDIMEVVLANLESKPLPIQYAVLCWAKGVEKTIPGFDFKEIKEKIKDEKVLAAFSQTEQVLEEYLEEEKGGKAFKDILWQKGWPVYKELIDKYVEDEGRNIFEEIKKMIQEMVDKAIEEQAKDLHKEAGQEGGEENKGKEGGGEKDESVPHKEEHEKAKNIAGDSSEQIKETEKNKEKEEGKDVEENLNNEDAKKTWEELTDEEKERYKQKAREKLTEAERELVKILQPQSMGLEEKEDGSIDIKMEEVREEDIQRAEAEEKIEEQKLAEQKQTIKRTEEESAKKAKESLNTLKERETGLSERERALYDVYYAPVKKYVDHLVERLDEVFPPQKEGGWEGGYRRGKKIDTKSLAREVPIERGKFFKKKETEEIKELAFYLLIDASGSMARGNIEEALKAAILMAEVLSKKGIPFEIAAFNAKMHYLKDFDETYFGKKKLELMKLLSEVHSDAAAFNDDGFAINEAAQRLQKKFLENDASGALIVFSDGQPVPSPEHDGSEWELHGVVSKWSKKIPLIGVGIGPGMEGTIKRYYDKNGLPVPDVHNLPQAFLRILERQLERFEKR